jgi:hypothetical protein
MRKLFALLGVAGVACVWSAGAVAQTKFSGTCTCKTSQQQLLAVGDRPEHSLGVEQYKCDWTKPIELGGDKAKDGVATNTTDVSGTKSRFRGVHVITMQSGDKVSFPYQGSGESSKDGKEAHSKGTFTVADGTGKLKGVSGKGTFSCKSTADGLSCEVDGEYQSAK